MRRRLLRLILPSFLAALAPGVTSLAAAAPDGPPSAARRPVSDRYFDVEVVDDYRWLENGADPAVRAWSDAENAWARSILDGLPSVAAIRARVREIEEFPTPFYGKLVRKGGRLFALKTQPPKQQSFLVTLDSADAPSGERVVVDPNALDPKGGTSIDWFVPSPDGRLVAVSLSEGGSETGTVHVYETATGRALPDVIPRVNGGTAGGDVAWNGDASGLLLHPLSPAGRAARGRPRVLPAGLLPSSRRARRIRRLRPRPGASAHRRDHARILRRRPFRSRDRQERRWRRGVAVSPGRRRGLETDRRRRGPRRARSFRLRRLPLPSLLQGRAARDHPAPARGSGRSVGGFGRRPRRRRGHRRLLPDRHAALRGRARRRPIAHPRFRA